jgi:hypothetical protein
MTVTKKDRVLKALKSGKSLTKEQIQSRFNVASPSRVVSSLRNEGYAIYLNSRVKRNGTKTRYYRLGTPSQSLLANWAAAGITPKTV